MIDVATLAQRLFDTRDGELVVGGVPVGEVAETTGTPAFVYDSSVITGSVQRLREALPSPFDLYYSIKANPNQAILGLVLEQGCGLEVASAGEFYQALKSGCPPDRILFAGPGKNVEELDYVVDAGIGEIHVESIREIDALAAVATRRGRRVGVAVRVNPGEGALGGAMRMGGQPSQFGIDEEALEPAIDRVLSHTSLQLLGIHLFAGTQILDHETLVRQYRNGLEIAQKVVKRTGSPLRTVDFGGGLGIPYYAGDNPLDVESLGHGVTELVSAIGTGPEFQGTRFIVEPGRFVVGEAGIYLCRVIDIKVSRNKTYVIVDGGMNHHLAASGNLGQVIKRNFPVGVLNKLDRRPATKVDVVGPLCTPLDVLARAVELPEIEVGDLVGVFQSGAYARAASPLGFLSHPAPPEALVLGGDLHIVRRRGSFESLVADQLAPEI